MELFVLTISFIFISILLSVVCRGKNNYIDKNDNKIEYSNKLEKDIEETNCTNCKTALQEQLERDIVRANCTNYENTLPNVVDYKYLNHNLGSYSKDTQKPSLFLCSSAEEAKMLIKLGADVNERDDDGNTPLHLCDDINIAKVIIQAGGDIYAMNKKGFTVKMMCKNKEIYYYVVNIINDANEAYDKLEKYFMAEYENEAHLMSDDIRVLINAARFSEKFSSLIFKANKIEIIEMLINAGANIFHSYMPLHECSSIDVVKFLIEKGVNVNGSNKRGNTSLHLCNDENIARLLIKFGANVNQKNENGSTPLHLCNDENIARLLIEFGADVNQKNKNGNMPLHLCFINDDENIFRYSNNISKANILIEAGANVIEKNNIGQNIINVCNDFNVLKLIYDKLDSNKSESIEKLRVFKKMIALAEEQYFDTFQDVIKRVDQDDLISEFFSYLMSDKRNEYKKLHIILDNITNIKKLNEYCYKEGILFLLNNDFFWIKAFKDKGVNLDIINCDGQNLLHKCNNYSVAKLLIDSGINVNQRDNIQRSPLFYCINKQIVKLFIRLGADVNLQDDEGMTFLHICNKYEIVKILLKNGANPNAKDKNGNTPLHYCKNVQIWEILVSSGAKKKTPNKLGHLPQYPKEEVIGLVNWDGSSWYDQRDDYK